MLLEVGYAKTVRMENPRFQAELHVHVRPGRVVPHPRVRARNMTDHVNQT